MSPNTKATGMATNASGALVIIIGFVLNSVLHLNVPVDVAVAAASILAPIIHSVLDTKVSDKAMSGNNQQGVSDG